MANWGLPNRSRGGSVPHVRIIVYHGRYYEDVGMEMGKDHVQLSMRLWSIKSRPHSLQAPSAARAPFESLPHHLRVYWLRHQPSDCYHPRFSGYFESSLIVVASGVALGILSPMLCRLPQLSIWSICHSRSVHAEDLLISAKDFSANINLAVP